MTSTTARPDASTRVVLGYPFGQIEPAFHHSLLRLKDFDLYYGGGYLAYSEGWIIAAGTTNITRGRNSIVKTFLEQTDADWLWFCDTDQTLEPDTLEKLMASADAVERPIVSALIMANREIGIGPACVIPDEQGNTRVPNVIPDDRWWACLPGTGCVVIHRSVLEKVGELNPDKFYRWFVDPDFIHPVTGEPDTIGEDYAFMLRAIQAGFTPLIDTTIHVGHVKKKVLTPLDYGGYHYEDKTFVVIPAKDNLKLTQQCVRELHEQGGYESIFIFDNGSNSTTKGWLNTQTYAEVLDAEGLGIHEMWNQGVTLALSRWPRCNLLFLNNDTVPGPDMVANLRAALRADENRGYVALSPNYDGRQLEGVEETSDICGEVYDGTGGWAGFAFMVKGEWFQHGYRFPEFCKWWYGDNHFQVSVRAAGGKIGITGNATVEHVGGGGQTGKWRTNAEIHDQLAKDRAAFTKWYESVTAA